MLNKVLHRSLRGGWPTYLKSVFTQILYLLLIHLTNKSAAYLGCAHYLQVSIKTLRIKVYRLRNLNLNLLQRAHNIQSHHKHLNLVLMSYQKPKPLLIPFEQS